METPPDNDKAKKKYKRPLTIFEASSYIKSSVPIESDLDDLKKDNNENDKGKDPDLLFPPNLLF